MCPGGAPAPAPAVAVVVAVLLRLRGMVACECVVCGGSESAGRGAIDRGVGGREMGEEGGKWRESGVCDDDEAALPLPPSPPACVPPPLLLSASP